MHPVVPPLRVRAAAAAAELKIIKKRNRQIQRAPSEDRIAGVSDYRVACAHL